MARDDNARREIETILLEHVRSVYALWWSKRLQREPNLTVAYLTGYVKQHSRAYDLVRFLSAKHASALVRNALDRLVRIGALIPTIGCGERGGEARCYEPAHIDQKEN